MTACSPSELRAADHRRATQAARASVREIDMWRAAVKMQSMWRGYVVRDEIRSSQEQRAFLAMMRSITCIQRRYRGFHKRKLEKEQAALRERDVYWASGIMYELALCVLPQAELRILRNRKRMYERAIVVKRAVRTIQRHWRSHITRRLEQWLPARPKMADVALDLLRAREKQPSPSTPTPAETKSSESPMPTAASDREGSAAARPVDSAAVRRRHLAAINCTGSARNSPQLGSALRPMPASPHWLDDTRG